MNFASIKQFIALFDIPILLLSENACILQCSEILLKIFNIKKNNIIHHNYYEFCKQWQLEEKLPSLSKMLLGQNDAITTYTILNIEKTLQWHLSLISNIEEKFILLFALDTSVFNENSLKINDISNTIIDLIPNYYIFWKNTESVYLGCNAALAKALGFNSSKDIIGKTDYDLPTTKKESDAYRADDQEVMLTGSPKLNIEEEQTLANGEKRILSTSKVPLLNKHHQVYGVLAVYTDITQQKQLEQDLRKAKEQAESANRAKSEFLRNMEHQLRTPFSGVYSMVEFLATNEIDPEKKALLELTYQSAKEFLDLLNDIIELSRNELDSSVILAKKFDLKDTINKAIMMEATAAKIKRVTIHFKYPKSLPNIFIGDPGRIRKLMLNLLSNAVKFTEDGRIDVSVKLAKKESKQPYILQLIVADTGIGISEEKQQYIFEKFYRGTPANTNKYSGSGIGLYIVKQIIEELNGEIDVQSSPRNGSIFICSLPFKRPLLTDNS